MKNLRALVACIFLYTAQLTADQPLLLSEKISFSYENEDLITIINFLAAKKNENIILPQDPDFAKIKVTLQLSEEVTIDDAWKLLQNLLDMAGYSTVSSPTGQQIVKNSNNINREPVPIYVGVKPQDLPNTDQRIWYLYYVSNLQVAKTATDTGNELNGIMKGLLPDPANQFRVDQATNALFIMAPANQVKSTMQIIHELDKATFKESMKIVNLRFTDAKTIAELFEKEILKASSPGTPFLRSAQPTQSENNYFSQQIRISAEVRTNSLIITGRKQAVMRVIDFIREYIDIPLESGKSVLHVYQLQYLDATTFAPILQKIVTDETTTGGTGQSKAAKDQKIVGTTRFFDEVIVIAEKPVGEASTGGDTSYDSTDSFGSQASNASGNATSNPSKPSYGNNKLIVAARRDDWKRIKQLIQQLDTPMPQVLLEILVADLTITDTRQLGSILRNPANIPILNESGFQSAQLNPGIILNSISDPETIAIQEEPTRAVADILPIQGSNGGLIDPAELATPGSTMISLNDSDGTTWSILQITKLFSNSKILSHPHVLVTNNKEAVVKIGQTRRVAGPTTGSYGGTTVQQRETISASLTINITPRISASGNINLTVALDIDEFVAESNTVNNTGNNTRATRNVNTNANVFSSDILAIGGLIRSQVQQDHRSTPILSKIPILGWFFKSRNKAAIQNNLTVFISPTIIMPRFRDGINDYTRDYLKMAKMYSQEVYLFESLRDPITHWFFKTGVHTEDIVEDFLIRDQQNITAPEHPVSAHTPRRGRRSKSHNHLNKAPLPPFMDVAPLNVTQREQQDDRLKQLTETSDNPFTRV